MTPSYEHARPAVTADVVLVRGSGDSAEVLLIRRGRFPFEGMWALPGGFVDEGETLEGAARRELAEETGLSPDVPLVQIGAFGDPGRDPRGWNVTVAFAACVDDTVGTPVGADDAAEAAWHPASGLPAEMGFDHADIVAAALERLA